MEQFGTLPPCILWNLLSKESRSTFKSVCTAARSFTDTSTTVVQIRRGVDHDVLHTYLERLHYLSKLHVDQLDFMAIVASATHGRVRTLCIEGCGLSFALREACAVRLACPALTDLSMFNQGISYTFMTASSLRHMAGCPLRSLFLTARWSEPLLCYRALGSFTQLRSLDLCVTGSAILEPLASWTALKRLEACRISIEDSAYTPDTPDTSIAPLLQLTGLTSLKVHVVSTGDGSALTPISALSNLTSLDLGPKFNVATAALEGLRFLTRLTSLGLGSIVCDGHTWLLPDLQTLALTEAAPHILHRTLRPLHTSLLLVRLSHHRYTDSFSITMRCADLAAADAESAALAQVTPRFPQTCPTSLCLSFSGTGFKPLSLPQLAVSLRFMSLHNLALHEWSFGANDDWADAAVAFSWMRSLDLERCDANDAGMRSLSEHMVLLTHLGVRKCSGVSNAGWVAMAAARPEGRLLHLIVPGMHFRVQDRCVAAGRKWILFC